MIMADEKKYVMHPFGWDFEPEGQFESFMQQRKASYTKPFETVYNNKHLKENELMWESFRDNIEPPTPPIEVIDGYKSEAEIEDADDVEDSDDTEEKE